MIGRLEPPRGAWDEDIVRLIEKVNELVDAVNEEKKELAELKKTAVDLAKAKADPKVKDAEIVAQEGKAKIQSKAMTKAVTERESNTSREGSAK